MSDWTKQKLDQMIADRIEEGLSVEYKGAGALGKTKVEKDEITKDVSSFANSSGGVIIYGIAEGIDKENKYLPERIDPICRTETSKEWLEQIIQNIQPRIDGVVIHPVMIDEQSNQACYVVEVPPSHTAHQARDHRYYKRHNFNVLPMEDYEIRDVMNRRTHPKIRASIFVNKRTPEHEPHGVILVRIENVGHILAHYLMVELEVPLDMNGRILVNLPVINKDTEEGMCYFLRLTPDPDQVPIFPGSDITLRRTFRMDVSAIIDPKTRVPRASTRHVKVTVYADEMPPLRATLDIATVITGWTLIGPTVAPG